MTGRDYDAREISQRIALLQAVDLQDLAAMSALLEANPELANAQLYAPDAGRYGTSFLSRSVYTWGKDETHERSVAAARLLIDAGADVNALGGQSHCFDASVIQWSAWQGNVPLVRYLLLRGATQTSWPGTTQRLNS